eukprot:4583758-Ditylum_brightwellii.AAC.1
MEAPKKKEFAAGAEVAMKNIFDLFLLDTLDGTFVIAEYVLAVDTDAAENAIDGIAVGDGNVTPLNKKCRCFSTLILYIQIESLR